MEIEGAIDTTTGHPADFAGFGGSKTLPLHVALMIHQKTFVSDTAKVRPRPL